MHVSRGAISCYATDGILQKRRGHLRGHLVVQTFAAHLAATEGAMAILDSNNASRLPIRALGLACASVNVVYCNRESVLTI